MHPLLAPFTSYYATQARFTRFSIHILQLNLVSTLVYIYYSAVYRVGEANRNLDVIEQVDIWTVLLSSVAVALLMTPWLSEPLIKGISNELASPQGLE